MSAAAGRGGLGRERLRLLAEIPATYAQVRWQLARRGLPETVARLRAQGGEPAAAAVDPWRYAQVVVRALRPLPADSRCLIRSLVLLAILARRGVEARLVIGVLPGPGFGAHAWLEHAGVPLLKPGAAREGRLVEL